MSLQVAFTASRTTADLDGPTALSLLLTNGHTSNVVVSLTPTGQLAEYVTLGDDTVLLEPGEERHTSVSFDTSLLRNGEHRCEITVSADGGTPTTVAAIVEVDAAIDLEVMLDPPTSSDPVVGRHRVVITNSGRRPVDVVIEPHSDAPVALDVATGSVIVEPGRTVRVELSVTARAKTRRNTPGRHAFDVEVRAEGIPPQLVSGVFEQQVPSSSWVKPAAIGAVGGLLLSSLAWLAIARPLNGSQADDAAADALAADRAELQERIAELEAAAARASELPLGAPTDLRLDANAAVGESVIESFTVTAGRVLSITDIVFQNPTGAIGSVALRRNGEVLLQSNLANFRDLDYHFVAPFRFQPADTIELEVTCQAAGAAADSCAVGTTLTGFVDTVDS